MSGRALADPFPGVFQREPTAFERQVMAEHAEGSWLYGHENRHRPHLVRLLVISGRTHGPLFTDPADRQAAQS